MPVRVMKVIGIQNLIVTNAAGGLNPNFRVGDVMIIKDHINIPGFAGLHPLKGQNDGRFGTRFFAVNNCYDKEYRIMAKNIHESMDDKGIWALHEGVYAMVGGPNFETVAEIRMLKVCGIDAIGKFLIVDINFYLLITQVFFSSYLHFSSI
jgi:purine-nucleoside phosphorylase